MSIYDNLTRGTSLPIVPGSKVAKRIYTCPECNHRMALRDEDVWGKIVRCHECAELVANNLDMREPASPK